MTDKKMDSTGKKSLLTSRRKLIKGLGAAAGASAALGLMPGSMRYIQAQSSAPIKIGFQAHRTGIGASYGRWYERTSNAAVKAINDAGGINGRPVELVIEDDATDPKRGAEVVEKFATEHKVDVAFGTLFSHVVIGSAPAAGEQKLPYFVVSEGHHVASGTLNRYVFQPGITDVKSQVISMAPWIAGNLGKKVTMIFPDFAFGHDHRDYFSEAIAKQGGSIAGLIAIPPTETSFTQYFAQIPAETEVHLSRDGRAGRAHLRQGDGRAFRLHPAADVRLHRLPRGRRFRQPGPGVPRGHLFLGSLSALCPGQPERIRQGLPRRCRRQRSGRRTEDPKDVSTYSHMFGCWETLYVIKAAIEKAGYQDAGQKQALIEAIEAMTDIAEGDEHPQGDKTFNGAIHQAFGHQNISKVEGQKLVVAHRTSIEDGLYEPEADYTKMAL